MITANEAKKLTDLATESFQKQIDDAVANVIRDTYAEIKRRAGLGLGVCVDRIQSVNRELQFSMCEDNFQEFIDAGYRVTYNELMDLFEIRW